MTAKIIDGKSIANNLLDEIRNEILNRKSNGIRNPCLAVILIGDNPASHVYVKNKKLACEKVGIKSLSYDFNESITEDELLKLVKDINLNTEIDGILIQSPLPDNINEDNIINQAMEWAEAGFIDLRLITISNQYSNIECILDELEIQ